MLKLNYGKTNLTVFTSKYKKELYNDLNITIGEIVVLVSQVPLLIFGFLQYICNLVKTLCGGLNHS